MDDFRIATPHALRQLYHRRRAVTLSESDDDMVRLMGKREERQTKRALCGTKSYTGHCETFNRGQDSAMLSVSDSFQTRSGPRNRNSTSCGGNWQPFLTTDRAELTSPRISPVPWLLRRCFSSQDGGGGGGPIVDGRSCEGRVNATYATEDTQHLIDPSSSKSSHVASPTSMTSLSDGDSHDDDDDDDDDDVDAEEDNEHPQPLRERRKAIFDSKSLCLTSPLKDFSPHGSCDEGEISGPELHDLPRRRKKSSADLGIHYPGDLLSQARPRRIGRPLNSRNTIADFANTKAYQASTASLISACEQDRKVKTSFSLLKLIDKKSHRSKETQDLNEVLQNLKRSEFCDSYLSGFKGAHWFDLMDKAEDETDIAPDISDSERKRREAVWELYTSEYVFLVDHLMALKHCFMEPLKKVQVEGYLMFAEPQDLFGNLDEVCSVSYTFCCEFIALLLHDSSFVQFGSSEVLIQGLTRFCQLTRDGEVYHDYCLNYSKAMTYLEQLRKNEDFVEFEKWCEQDPRCKRLLLTDLLISPMQHCTKVPLLLNNICKYTENRDEQTQLMEALEHLESSLKNLEAKMNWLKNFERIQEIQQQIVWMSIAELEPRAFIPEFLKPVLSRQPCERILASPKRQLLHEGPVVLIEVSKTIDMYLFLFDDILLLTKVKKSPRKTKPAGGDTSSSYMQLKSQTEGAVFTVYRQPIALDRFTIHDIRQPDSPGMWFQNSEVTAGNVQAAADALRHGGGESFEAIGDDDDECSPPRSNLFLGCLSAAANGLRNAFVLVQITRFQQVIGVYTLQAPSESAKVAWMTRLPESQEKYRKLHKAPLEPSLSSDQLPPPLYHHHHPQQQQQQQQQQQSSSTDIDPCVGSHHQPPQQQQPIHTTTGNSSVPGSPRTPGGGRTRTPNTPSPSRGPGVIEPQRTVWNQSPEQSSVFDYPHVVGPTSSTATASPITIERTSDPSDVWGSTAAITPPWPSPASTRGSKFLSPPSQGYALLGDTAREMGGTTAGGGSDVFDRLRAKSLRIRHRPNLRTIREKSQSIDTLHK